MKLHTDDISCDECGRQSPCIGLGRNDATMVCTECVIKAFCMAPINGCAVAAEQLLNDTAEFKGILHELSASDMDCDVVHVEPFGGTATIHG